MSDIVYIRQKYKEITGNANADDVPIYAMKQVVKAYEKGRADAIKDVMSVLNPCATCCECDMGYFIDKCMADNCDLKWKDIIEKLEQLKEQKK